MGNDMKTEDTIGLEDEWTRNYNRCDAKMLEILEISNDAKYRGYIL